jgi:hypothetical protein
MMYARKTKPTIGNKIGQFWDNTVDLIRKNAPTIIGGVTAVAGLAAPLAVGIVTADPNVDLAEQIGEAYMSGLGMASTAVGAVSGLFTAVPSVAKTVGGAIDKVGDAIAETAVGKVVGAFYNNTLDMFKNGSTTNYGPLILGVAVGGASAVGPLLVGAWMAGESNVGDLEHQISKAYESTAGIAALVVSGLSGLFTVAGYDLAERRQKKREQEYTRRINRDSSRRENNSGWPFMGIK